MTNTVSSGEDMFLEGRADVAMPDRSASLRCLAEVAQRLSTMLHAADVLTERHHLSELDRMTLDGLLIAGRDYANELVWRIEQLSLADKPADTPPNSLT